MPTLDGDDTAITATYQIDVWSETSKECNDVGEAVKACLDNFSGGNITQTRWEGQELTSEESDAENRPNYHLTQEYTVHGDDALFVATSSGVPKVEVREDGLYFDNTKIGTAADVDLSNYARTDEPNTFTQPQTTGPLTVSWALNQNFLTLLDRNGATLCNVNMNGTAAFANYYNLACYATTRIAQDGSCTAVGHSDIDTAKSCWIKAGDPSRTTVVIQAIPSQTGDLLQIQDSTGNKQFAIAPDGKIKTNQTAAATTLGNVVGKMPVYGTGGTLVGYMPIYDNIT
jgi:hypothetical protein